MSANPPESGAPQSHVFRAHSDIEGLSHIEPDTWQQIVQHALPLQPANAAVRLIVVTGTAISCNSIEALQVQTDNFGFLRNWDTNLTQSMPPLENQEKREG